ncbi:MAG: hypothetical protein J0L53_12745 [Spirochaetes bacterium]|nr:hypothetical protein [Spirochaetota bacterium]
MRLILCAVVVATVFCSKRIDLKKEGERYDAYVAALPELRPVPNYLPLTLSVLYAEADNLPTLTADERTRLYRNLEAKAALIYGYRLQVREIKARKLPEFFTAVKSRFREFPLAYPSYAFPISFFDGDREKRIAEALSPLWKKHDAATIRMYLGDVTDAQAAAREFLAKLSRIYAENDLQGKPLLASGNKDDEMYFSYGHWSSVLQAEKNADFILTNTGIIGADTGMPLYVAARGGVTSGFIENNAASPYQGVGVIGLYPFLAETPYFNEKRGALSREEKLESILWLWLHELGHLLLKRDENYTFIESLHRAPPDLKYFEWVKTIRYTFNHRTFEIPQMKKF